MLNPRFFLKENKQTKEEKEYDCLLFQIHNWIFLNEKYYIAYDS